MHEKIATLKTTATRTRWSHDNIRCQYSDMQLRPSTWNPVPFKIQRQLKLRYVSNLNSEMEPMVWAPDLKSGDPKL